MSKLVDRLRERDARLEKEHREREKQEVTAALATLADAILNAPHPPGQVGIGFDDTSFTKGRFNLENGTYAANLQEWAKAQGFTRIESDRVHHCTHQGECRSNCKSVGVSFYY